MKRRFLIVICCVIAVAVLIVATKLLTDGHGSGVSPTTTPTPSFDEQVNALGWKSYGHFGEFDLSTDSPTNAWGRDEEAQGYIDAITEAIIYGN